MRATSGRDKVTDHPTSEVRKTRQCLRCNVTFSSRWSGERVCVRCKSSAAWRSGLPPNSYGHPF